MALSPGTRLGPYEIIAALGAGGMGEVYRARDARLGREVALKLVPPHLAQDEQARSRFHQEARTLSTLNHPNIATLFEFDSDRGTEFLIMELVPGESLRRRLSAGPLSLSEFFSLATQIARGLSAAHAAGIVHRDLKPENLIVTSDGHLKILDFGLAKYTSAAMASAATVTYATDRGAAPGTLPYMAPEQVRGEEADARIDLYAAGAVLYEMATGRRLFDESGLMLVDAILHRDPAPPRSLNPAVPAELNRIILRALDKRPDRRYQSARELAADLERLQLSTVSGRLLASAPRTRWMRSAAAAAIAAVALAAILLVLRLRDNHPALPNPSQYVALTNFADSATSPALSRDGRMLTFIRGPQTFLTPGQVYVKLLPDGEPVQLTHDGAVKMGPKFSPDGTQIAYTVRGASYDTWVVPTLGGHPPLRFLANSSGLTWLDSGGSQPHLLYTELTGHAAQMPIVTSTQSRTDRRYIYMPPETGMVHRAYVSPDGNHVLGVEMDAEWLPCRLVPFDGSSKGKQVGPIPSHCTDAAWSPDGKWMYFSANTGGGFHIWRQRFPDGVPEQVTFGVTEEEGISFAPDGRSFVTSIGASQSTVWIHDSRGERQLTSEGFSFLPALSRDEKKVYYLVRTRSTGIYTLGGLWVVELESGQRQPLLPDFQMQQYSFSPDGQRIVFVAAEDNGRTSVWVASLDGRKPPQRVVSGKPSTAYFTGPDEVLFVDRESGVPTLRRFRLDGTELPSPIKLPALYLFTVSPDGKWLVAPGGTDEVLQAIILYPVAGGAPVIACRACTAISYALVPPPVNWSPDGKYFYLRFEGSTFSIPLSPGQSLPPIPSSGFQSKKDVAALPGARLVSDEPLYPGATPSLYVFSKNATQRNIYRVPLP